MKKTLLVIIILLFTTLQAQDERMVSSTSYLYNTSTMTWDFSSRAIINYYETGLRMEDKLYYWEDAAWNLKESYSSRQEYTYDANGNEIQRLNSLWQNSTWSPVWLYERTYDGDGNLTSYFEKNWDGTDWINWAKTEYTYTSNTMVAVSNSWSNSTWENSSKSEYQLDNAGLKTERNSFLWRDGTWAETGRTLYTYDNNGHLLTEISEYLADGTYIQSSKQFKEYDANNNMTKWGFQTWNATNNLWDDVNRSTYTYNAQNQLTSHLLETFGQYYWTNFSKSEYEYSTATALKDNFEIKTDFHLADNYPNPFNPTTNISFNISTPSEVLLTIHNIAGEKVATLVSDELQAGNYERTFNANGLASGMYFYKLEANGFVEVKKMMLMK